MLRHIIIEILSIALLASQTCVLAADAEPSTQSDVSREEAQVKKLRFNFHFQPWPDALRWFAEQAGYSLILDAAPTGTLNYTDGRDYTPAEAMDLLNSVLLTKGYTLVLRDRILIVVNLEDKIPPSLVTRVAVEDLDKRGKYELVSARFQLKGITAEQAQKEVESLLGPQGNVTALPESRQLVVTETGGRLREIRDVLERADKAGDPSQQEIRWFNLTSVSPDEALALLRQIFEIPEGGNSTADGSLHFAADLIGMRLLASGEPRRIEQVAEMIKTIDQPLSGEPLEPGQQASPQIEIYDIAPADSDSVLKVMQTLLAEVPGTRLAVDPKTGYLIALARPADHATIRATVDQMRRDAQTVEVIQLSVLDPQMAVLAVAKLFGGDPAKAPSVDADPINRQLLIRGSAGQIAQIRILLEKMGETPDAKSPVSRGKLRVLPVKGEEAGELIGRIKALWPAVGENEIRVISGRDSQRMGLQRGAIDERTPVPAQRKETPPPASPQPKVDPQPQPGGDMQQQKPVRAKSRPNPQIMLVADEADATGAAESTDGKKPPILIFSGPQGLYVTSEDAQALDQLQDLVDALQGEPTREGSKLTVFYLRNAKAADVAERLNQILAAAPAATAAVASSPAPGGARGAVPAPAGIMGNIGAVGGIGRITPSAPVAITADARLNALLVQAAPADVDTIEDILKILDRGESTEEVPIEPKPRLIPLVHTAASDVAEIVKEVYKDRISGGNNRAASPAEQMMMMFRGRRGGPFQQPGNASNSNQSDAAKLSIGIDERSNSLIVLASEPLFEEVRNLVESLDCASDEDDEVVEVVTLRESNPAAVSAALSSLLGDSLQSGSASGVNRSPSPARSTFTRSNRNNPQNAGGGSNRRANEQDSQRWNRGSFRPGQMPGGGPPMMPRGR